MGTTTGSSVAQRVAEAAERAAAFLPAAEWAAIEPVVAEIWALKAQRSAVVLAHNYMTPDIFHTVADVQGDSLALAEAGAASDADVIVMAGVHFMAETAKVLSPDRTVLIPDRRAGCSLASSITPADIAALRTRHPGAPVVTYVNTTAAVKAASDVCCTSANAVEVVESLGAPKVLLVPDRYLAANVAARTGVEIVTWERGACEVHERFTAAEVHELRATDAEVRVIAHPECPPDVAAAADYVGSTAGMARWIDRTGARRVALLTECSMADNLAAKRPDVTFVRPCNLCPHMKRITLHNLRDALRHDRHRVEVPADVVAGARAALERMLAVGRTVGA